jgi:hypothetical protein
MPATIRKGQSGMNGGCYQISVEIEQKFFGRTEARPSQPPPDVQKRGMGGKLPDLHRVGVRPGRPSHGGSAQTLCYGLAWSKCIVVCVSARSSYSGKPALRRPSHSRSACSAFR